MRYEYHQERIRSSRIGEGIDIPENAEGISLNAVDGGMFSEGADLMVRYLTPADSEGNQP